MKTISKFNQHQIILGFILLFNLSNCFAGNFTWNGSTSTAWALKDNWTPSTIPSTNDTVTIVTGSNNVYLSAKTEVKRMIVNSGTMNLQGNQLIVNSKSNFNAGTVNNGLVTLTNSIHTIRGTTFGAKVSVLSSGATFDSSVFNDSLTFIKVSSKNPSTSKGGNTFNGAVMIKDS